MLHVLLLAALALFCLPAALAIVAVLAMPKGHAHGSGDGSAGTAAFATAPALRRHGYTAPGGYPVGEVRDGERRVPIHLPDRVADQHVLLVGPTGSGKTTRGVVPLLIEEASQDRTIIVADPRLDLFCLTAPLLARTHRVAVWAPLFPEISLRYDPLTHAATSVQAQDIARRWVDATGRGAHQPFFDDQEAALMTAAMLYIKGTHPKPTLQEVRRFLVRTKPEEMLDLLSAYAACRHDEVISDTVGTLERLRDNSELMASVLSGLGRRFSCLQSEAVVQTGAGNDLDVAALIAEPTVLYVHIPFADAPMLAPLSANFYATVLRRLHEIGGSQSPLSRRVRIVMDEFANVGKMTDFTSLLTTLRFKRVSITIAVQSTAQIIALYGEAEGTVIRDGCGTVIGLAGMAESDARYFSERLGVTTVPSVGRTARGGGFVPWPASSTTRGWQGRPLRTPEEVRRLRGQGVVVTGDERPILGTFTPYYEQPAMVDALARAQVDVGQYPLLAPQLAAVERAARRTGRMYPPVAVRRQPPSA